MTGFDGTRYPSSLASALMAASFRAATHSAGGHSRRCRSLRLFERVLGKPFLPMWGLNELWGQPQQRRLQTLCLHFTCCLAFSMGH